MEALMIGDQHNRNQYCNGSFTRFGSPPGRNREGMNCRSYLLGNVNSKSFSEASIQREIDALSPKTPSPSIYFSGDDSKNDGKPVRSSAVSIPMAMKLEDVGFMGKGDFGDGFHFSELWAGPTYCNSPPPSSLPIPKFSMRPKRTVSLELPSSVSPVNLRPIAKSAPASPTRERSPSHVYFLSDIESVMETRDQCYLQQESVDETNFATKALRRILNLDNGDQ